MLLSETSAFTEKITSCRASLCWLSFRQKDRFENVKDRWAKTQLGCASVRHLSGPLRLRGRLRVSRNRTEHGKEACLFHASHFWNKLLQPLKSAQSVSSFKE